MELTAVFESWLIPDGDYPPFHKGMMVNLAFQISLEFIFPAQASQELAFNCIREAEYDFCGTVIYIYRSDQNRNPLVVINTGIFRFYIESDKAKNLAEGMRVMGRGTLLLDYYIWTEYLHLRPNPPDIFYSIEVSRIRKVQIPERFIQRHDKAKGHPSWVSSADFGDVKDLETMEGQSFDEEFYLVDFKESNRKDVPKTFI